MRRYLLDTGIAGDYIHRRRGVYERARKEVREGHIIGIGTPVLAELYYGVEYSDSADRNRKLLQRSLPDLALWTLTEEASEIYGRLRAELRRGGRTIQAIDVMVAAIAFTLNRCIVVSCDSDLLAVKGLSVENWVT